MSDSDDTSSTNYNSINNVQGIDESVKSGESKFKILSFDPAKKDNRAVDKCVEFWRFMNSIDLEPAFPVRDNDVISGEELPETQQTDFKWSDAYKLLKLYKLDSISKSTGSNAANCKMCMFEGQNIEGQYNDDEFKLSDLTSFDPQKKYFTTIGIMTDPILTCDIGTMTSFLDPEEEKRGKILEKCKEIDDLMAQLAEMYPSVHSFDHTCTCEDDCRCIFQNEAIQDESILNLPIGRKNKCVCSCGQSFCLCSKLSKILREINMMNYDIKCDCIDGKVDVESILKVKLFCNCKNDNNCLCSIILQEFAMCDGSVCCSCLDVENEGKMLKCLNSAASSCTCSPLKRSANSLCGCGRAMIGTAEPMEIISCTTFQSQVSVLIASTTPVEDDSLINFFNPDEASTCEDLNKE